MTQGTDRTRNGLRKRTPRGDRPDDTAAAGPEQHRVIDLTAVRAGAVVDDSPAQVRSRLTSFRAGAERGRGTSTSSTSTAAPQPSAQQPQAQPPPQQPPPQQPPTTTGSDHGVEDSE